MTTQNVPPPEDHLYVFKPPPPYPGSNNSLQTLEMTSVPNAESDNQNTVITKERSHNQSSIKMGTSVSRFPPNDIHSSNSRSVSSSAVSVVSAEVHNVPNGKDKKTSANFNGNEVGMNGENKSATTPISTTSTKSLSNPSIPKTNGLLKDGNGVRKSSTTMHTESKVGL